MLKKGFFIFLLSCLGFMSVLCCNVHAQKESELIELKLEEKGIKLLHTNRFFYAPYMVKTGETFQSISEKFYGSRDQADHLAQAVGTTPDNIPAPGTIVYIITGEIFLNFNPVKAIGQAETVKTFIKDIKQGTLCEFKWSKVDILLDNTLKGNQVITKYNIAEIHLYATGSQKPTLIFVFDQKPLLELFEGKTQLTDVFIEK
jgi:hypothetical protein